MKRVFFGYLVIFALGISFLSAYAPLDREPGLSSQRGLEQVGLDAGSTANEEEAAPLSFSSYPIYANYQQDTYTDPFTSADYDSMAALDVVQFHFQLFDEDYRTGLVGLTDSLRVRNPDIVILDYFYLWGVSTDWASRPVGSWKRDYYDLINDNNFYLKDENGVNVTYVDSADWNNVLVNFSLPAATDSIADFIVRNINASGNLDDFTGIFFDFINYVNYPDWPCVGGCRSVMDLNEDGDVCDTDGAEYAEELAYYQASCDSLIDKIRRGLDTDKFVIAVNGLAYRSSSFGGKIDLAMMEYIDSGFPRTTSDWQNAYGTYHDYLSTDVLSTPALMYDVKGNAEDPSNPSEESVIVASLIGAGTANISATNPVATGGRLFWTPLRSAYGRIDMGTPNAAPVWYASTDTVYREYTKGYVKAVLVSEADLNKYPYEYCLVDTVSSATPDTIFRSSNWPRQADTTPPASPANIALVNRGADYVNISWDDNTEPDLSHYNIWRKQGTGLGSPTLFDEDITESYYSDTTVAADTTYYYAVTAVDDNDNESSTSQTVIAAHDTAAPAQITDLAVQGYYDEVDLIWTASNAADLDYYNLYRGTSSGSLSLFDTIESGNQGDYTDSTVDTSGDSTYYYAIAAVDSSGNEATLSNTVSATPEASLVIAAVDSLYDEGNELASVDFTANLPRMLSFRHQIDGGTWSSATTLDSAVTAATHYVDTSGEADDAEINIMAYYAGEDTASATVTIARTPVDTTPPDTTGVFVAVTIDTTNVNDVLLTLSDMTITGDPSQVQFEWSNDGGSNYYGDSSWSPASASTTVGDTISTNVSTENLNSDLYTRFRLRDDETTPNVSGWNVNAQVFERAADAANDGFIGTRASSFSSAGWLNEDYYYSTFNTTGGEVQYFYVRQYATNLNMDALTPCLWDSTGTLLASPSSCTNTEVSTGLFRYDLTTAYELSDGNYRLGFHSADSNGQIGVGDGGAAYKATAGLTDNACQAANVSDTPSGNTWKGSAVNGLLIWMSNDNSESD